METEPQLYLIAHKVRGEPAFDIATRMKCPICEPIRQGLDHGSAYSGCKDCDDEQYWWIIPTSGHRAYPYWFIAMEDIDDRWDFDIPSMPPDLPDHYTTTADKGRGKITGLSALLGIKRPTVEIKRRI